MHSKFVLKFDINGLTKRSCRLKAVAIFAKSSMICSLRVDVEIMPDNVENSWDANFQPLSDFHGDAGNDKLWGGKGDNFLIGGSGADHLLGDAGMDILTWRSGKDIFCVCNGHATIENLLFSDAITYF